MLTRMLWTCLIALLAWLPVGRGQALLSRGDVRDRQAVASVALDNATDPPSRVVRPAWAQPQFAAQRRPWTPYGVPAVDDAANTRRRDTAHRIQSGPVLAQWRGFRAKRLIAPHDAIAPPHANR